MGFWDGQGGGFNIKDIMSLGADRPVDSLLNGGDRAAAAAQQKAAADALAQQKDEAQRARDFFSQQSQQGINFIDTGANVAADNINQYSDLAHLALGQSYGDARSATQSGYGQGINALQGGLGQARGDLQQLAGLQGYAGQATNAINSYDVTGQPRRMDTLGQDFQADPGYQFRQQQGEQAINRAASAQGGRLGGRTMKALADYNQNLASQEFGNFAQRQMAADQMDQSAAFNQAGRVDAARMAAQGNAANFAGMGYGAQNSLANLAAQGGAQLAGMYQGRGQSLADLASQYGAQQSGMLNQQGSQLADIYNSAGANKANISIGAGSNNTALSQSLMGAFNNPVQYAGAGEQATSNNNKQALLAAASIFSDVRLKTDVETVPGSKYEAIGLRGVRWTWNERAAELGLNGRGEGVIAQEVAELYPEAVVEDGGLLRVRYDLLDSIVVRRAA